MNELVTPFVVDSLRGVYSSAHVTILLCKKGNTKKYKITHVDNTPTKMRVLTTCLPSAAPPSESRCWWCWCATETPGTGIWGTTGL